MLAPEICGMLTKVDLLFFISVLRAFTRSVMCRTRQRVAVQVFDNPSH
jgi:hypothetical protein